MARVFLSYDRDDLSFARRIAEALEKAGHSVWWDHRIKGGVQFSKEIETEVNRADAVVVLWSRNSIESPWVRDEASAGRDRGCLVPVALDDTAPPMGFRQYHTLDLSSWKSGRRHPQLSELFETVDALASGGNEQSGPAADPPARTAQSSRRLLAMLVAGVLLIAGAAALFLWQPWKPAPALPVVAIRAADATAESRALTRDLLARLGNVQSTHANAPQLIEADSATKADLILEVAGSLTAAKPAATLVLLRGRDQQLLSSHAFEAGAGEAGDLKQSLAMSASRLLDCATEALQPRRRTFAPNILKLYLDACSRFATLHGHPDIAILAPKFTQVVTAEPGFAPAWKQLLLTEAWIHTLQTVPDKSSVARLKAHIAAARAIDADMAEAAIAEIELLPATDYARRMAAIDALAERDPDNPVVLDTLSQQLMRVGRMNEAVETTDRAVKLDPISPSTRNAHIRTLAFSGRVDRAFQELGVAAPLSLGAENLREARFRLNMRFGDPQLALDLLRLHGTSKQHEAFLQARIDPSPANVERALAVSRTTLANAGHFGTHAEVLAAFGRNDELFELLLKTPAERFDPLLQGTLFRPNLASFRQDRRFLRVAAHLGLLDYWRNSGKWPDFCADSALPYDCKARP